MDEKTIERKLLIEILTRLDEHQLLGIMEELEKDGPLGGELRRILEEDCHWNPSASLTMEELKDNLKKELEHTNGNRREFYRELIRFVDRAQKTDAEVYNAIGMNRTLWYRLRDNKNARTNKRNVLKMAIFLQLDYWEMYYLINLAGYSLMPGDDSTDRIVAFCIRRKIYDRRQIDELLWEAGETPLFSDER